MSAGISSWVDAGTHHPDADSTCWWCLKRVLAAAHDFGGCHEDMKPKPRPRKRTCSCHADDSLYGGLIDCPSCKHRSYDPGVGCERRKCASVEPATEQLALL